MLSIKNIKAYYFTSRGTVKAVDNVSFDVLENEILGIAGESGCGKSTLLKVMYGFVQPPLKIVSGEIKVKIKDKNRNVFIFNNNEMSKIWWKYISYIPQGSMSVLNPVTRIENQFFDAVSRLHGMENKEEIRKEISSYLKDLGLPIEVLKSFPHQLSGGMRQRVIVAMATFLKPKIVLADEPTTSIDVVIQRGILEMLRRLQLGMQNALVIVSHDIGVHYQLTHRMMIMYAGKIVEEGLTESIFKNPLHPYTKLLMKSLPRIGDHVERKGIDGVPPSLTDPPSGCRFWPRCPYVMEVCKKEEPRIVGIEPNCYVACHLFDKP